MRKMPPLTLPHSSATRSPAAAAPAASASARRNASAPPTNEEQRVAELRLEGEIELAGARQRDRALEQVDGRAGVVAHEQKDPDLEQRPQAAVPASERQAALFEEVALEAVQAGIVSYSVDPFQGRREARTAVELTWIAPRSVPASRRLGQVAVEPTSLHVLL